MLVVETIGRIRRAYFVKGKPIKEIDRYGFDSSRLKRSFAVKHFEGY